MGRNGHSHAGWGQTPEQFTTAPIIMVLRVLRVLTVEPVGWDSAYDAARVGETRGLRGQIGHADGRAVVARLEVFRAVAETAKLRPACEPRRDGLGATRFRFDRVLSPTTYPACYLSPLPPSAPLRNTHGTVPMRQSTAKA